MMESISYEGWKITTQLGSEGFKAVTTDPNGKIYHQATICWQDSHSARRHAKEFIDWYIKFEEHHREQDDSVGNLNICEAHLFALLFSAG